MLDLGCGIGRKTFLLTDYPNDEGSYEGLDTVKTGIDCAPNELPASDLVRGDTILGAIPFDPLDSCDAGLMQK
jgi:trans-aconitate methyltransferase